MKTLKLSILLPLLGGLFCSCVSDTEITEADRLTKTEEEIVISHVRRFVTQAKKLNLSPAEREVIRTARPGIQIHYTGHKTGRLSIRWSLPNYRVLLLQRSGNLLSSERADWTVRIISDQASGKIPKNFYGANGEDISLPPR